VDTVDTCNDSIFCTLYGEKCTTLSNKKMKRWRWGGGGDAGNAENTRTHIGKSHAGAMCARFTFYVFFLRVEDFRAQQGTVERLNSCKFDRNN